MKKTHEQVQRELKRLHVTRTHNVTGAWSRLDPRRWFVAGAQWWEFTKTGATMWPSDRNDAEAEADRRYQAERGRE